MTCCCGAKWPREGAKTPQLLLEGETSDKFMLCLMWMQAGNGQGHQDLANLSARGWHRLMLWAHTGSFDAESTSVGMHFHCCRCQDEVFPPSPPLLLLVLFQQLLASVPVWGGLKHTRLLKCFYILYVNACWSDILLNSFALIASMCEVCWLVGNQHGFVLPCVLRLTH